MLNLKANDSGLVSITKNRGYKIKMTQTEQIKEIADKTGVSQSKVKEVLTAQAELAGKTLKTSDEFVLLGFGKLKAKNKPERDGRNPSTGEPVKIAASRRVTLTLGKAFKESVK